MSVRCTACSHDFMTKYDIGKLSHRDRVSVNGRKGTVVSVHEPQWIDHKTRAQQHVLQGADIAFDDEPEITRYIHCEDIILANASSQATKPAPDGSR